MVDLPLDKVQGFLKEVSPFWSLPDTVLKEVAKTLLIDYVPQGEIVFGPRNTDNTFLYLVFSGVIHCFNEKEASKQTLRYVAEKDHFGAELLLTGAADYTAQVQEDMVCYLVRPRVFKNLVTQFEGFAQYFDVLLKPLSVQICHHVRLKKDLFPDRIQLEKSSSSQFDTCISRLVNRVPVCCERRSTASEIARLMTLNGVGSVIVTQGRAPVGIVTKNDLTEKVLARKRGGDVTASQIMSRTLVTMPHTGSCFEASLKMLANQCHHMVAIKNGALFGVISQHDLIVLQGANPIAVVGAIDKQKDVVGLKTCVRDMSVVQKVLLAEGGGIEEIWNLMTAFRDTLTKRLLVLGIEALRRQGEEPPIFEFSWITFGTPGREETLLGKNVLEGFIYRDPDGNDSRQTASYLQKLSNQVKEGLLQCGLLDDVRGKVLCLSESEWRHKILEQISGNAALDSETLRIFDLRGVLEQWRMVDALREFVFEQIARNQDFVMRLTRLNDPDKIPKGFYGDLVLTPRGFREEFELKKEVLEPLVDAVRAFALAGGVTALGTLSRIDALCEKKMLPKELGADLKAVYTWIVETGLRRSLQESDGTQWTLDPQQCCADEKRLFTESFGVIRSFVKRVHRKSHDLKT
ncbi:MAG: CBS domain-containing protein [Deltaproteobacteria bacterium]|nr:CBS domain-containing protein [Deltaproteobacteria bacterium]